MKKIVLLIAGCFFCVDLFCQQDPQFSQNIHNLFFPNPGVAGSNNVICATLMSRQQWMGMEGRPKTYLFTVHSPIPFLHGGAGFSAYKDELGNEKTTAVKAAYAYRLALKDGELGFGASAGLINKSIGNDPWKFHDKDDVAIPQNNTGKTGFDLDFGAFYKMPAFFLGLSATHITQSELKNTIAYLNYKISRHYYFMAGYNYNFKDIPLAFQPMVFVKSDVKSTQLDINTVILFNNLVWGGISYRLEDAVAGMIGVKKEISAGTMKFGYSYDLTTSPLKMFNSGTHEIVLGFCFKWPKNTRPQKTKSVRFL